MHSPTLLLKPLEAAKALAISHRTLWELTRSGKIPHVRLSRKIIRYRLSDLEMHVEEQIKGGQSHD